MSSEEHEFEIELGTSSVRRHQTGVSPSRDRSKSVFPCGSPERKGLRVYIAAEVIRAIRRQAADNPGIEAGGVLLGQFRKSGKEAFLEVTGVIEAEDAESTGISLTFTHDTWEHIARRQAEVPDSAIVGWYHSHPGLGVFLSREDRFIHSGYFAEPWQVALVVDPESGELGLFAADGGELRQMPGFYVFGGKEEEDAVRECAQSIKLAGGGMPVLTAAGRWRAGTAVWAVIAALVLAQIVTGFMLVARRQAPAKPRDYFAQAEALLSACDLSGAEQLLRLALVDNPSNENAARELRRLAALSQVPGVQSSSMDRINFLLWTADRAARGGVKPVGRGELEGLVPGKEGTGLRVEARDPALEAFRAYKEAASSSAARLARAIAVERAARPFGSTAWPKRAVDWIKNERLRETAYGLHTGQSGYERIYERLPESGKAAVRAVRASIGRDK